MSYLTSNYVDCEILQSMLNDEFVTCPTPQESMPALEAILATQKAMGIAQSVAGDNGKVKNIRVVYDQRLLESAVTSGSGARTCTSTTETFDKSQIYDIDPNVWLKAEESFTTVSLATVCTNDVQSMIANKIGKVVDALERKIATQTANQLALLFGNWSSNVAGVNGSDELVISTLISTAAKTIDYTGSADLDLALMQTGYCGTSIVVGGTTMYKYGRYLDAGCCSDTGVDIMDIGNKYGKAFLYDKRLATALGSESKSIVFQAGSLALIHYNEAPQVANLGANYAKFRVNSPRTGIPIDIVLSDACGTISVIGYANTKLVGLPTDMYKIGDEYQGVVYVNKVLVTNAA